MFKAKALIILGFILLLSLPLTAVQGAGHALAEAKGSITFSDYMAFSDRVTFDIQGAVSPGAGKTLEGWLVANESGDRVSAGVMTAGPRGNIRHSWNSPGGENLFEQGYDTVIITVEPSPDTNAAPSDEVAYSYTIPGHTLTVARHLVSHGPPPDNDPAAPGLLTLLQDELSAALALARTAKNADTLESMKTSVQQIVDMIEGDAGILRHETEVHTEALRERSNDPVVLANLDLVHAYETNAETWTLEALDHAKVILEETRLDIAKIFINIVIGNLEAARNGAMGGKGGIKQAYQAAQKIATFSVPAYALPTPPAPPPPPDTGDTPFSTLAQATLLIALATLGLGVLLYWKRPSVADGA